ncbi:hypothetical protein ACH5RR_025707 [Cinchona calisaya]|uniref:MULE transposase domain-containing protein n=1 Tax=Cinchona calisaya TaxID=153742 RepID=A0ABD2Z0F3_9GENT
MARAQRTSIPNYGLIQTIGDLLPGVDHRMCIKHMYNNSKKEHSELTLKDRTWATFRTSYVNLFAFHMEQLKDVNDGAYKWLIENTNPKNWSKSSSRTTPKCDILLNNIYESFNSTIL